MSKSIAVFGYYAAIITFILTIVTFGIAIFTPPFSGPGCTDNCFQYPYTDVASRFPRDYWWMYFAILLTVAYFVLMTAIHYAAPPAKKMFSFLGVSCALLATGLLVTDYYVQLSVIQPSLLLSETDGVSMLSQFNPHGLFIALEELGYMFMILSFVSLIPVFDRPAKPDTVIRRVFASGFILTIIALSYFLLVYGLSREYRFEIAAVTISWAIIIITGLPLAKWFKQKSQPFK